MKQLKVAVIALLFWATASAQQMAPHQPQQPHPPAPPLPPPMPPPAPGPPPMPPHRADDFNPECILFTMDDYEGLQE